MSDMEGLKTRVEQAVEQLSSVQNARHDQNQNLTSLLGGLEEKFTARTVELEYCNSQIAALTQDNAQLSELLERLVLLIESGSGDAEDDPLIRASTMAASLLEGWSGGETQAAGSESSEETPEPQELVSEDSVSMSFEDVSQEELDAEILAAPEGAIPDLVADAIAAAVEEGASETEVLEEIVAEVAEEAVEEDIVDEPVAADIEIPATEFDAEDGGDDFLAEEIEEDVESSIRAMMARLEAAAHDAKFASGSDSDAENAEQVA